LIESLKPEVHETIEVNEHLSLRPLTEQDADDLFAAIDASRPELRKWLPWVDATKSPEDSKAFIAGSSDKRNEGQEFGYGIIVDGKIAGHVSIMNPMMESAEVGYWVATDVAGKGFATVATKAISELGLTTLSFQYLTLRADQRNTASQRVAEKAGFVKTGEHQDKDHSGQPRTVFDYELRRNDQTAEY
jgi:ribosomal-protein-serine acetyltransferase